VGKKLSQHRSKMDEFTIDLSCGTLASVQCSPSFVEYSGPRPLVIIIGWYASTLRQLQHYKMLHRSIAPNCTIMTIILPRDVVFGAPLALDSGINDQVEVLDKLSAAILEDARLAHTSITIHGFSNGAIHLTRHLNYPHEFFATYPHIRYLKENLTSIIYDR